MVVSSWSNSAGTRQQESLEGRLEVVEIAPRDENRHIIIETVFPRETGRTLKDIFARGMSCFRDSIGIENQQIVVFQLNRERPEDCLTHLDGYGSRERMHAQVRQTE
jgi:hypothetical protein